MKIKTSILILIILLVNSCLLISCVKGKTTPINENLENRIKLKNKETINNVSYTIIEIDSIEYLTSNYGGFVQLSK
jgi:nitrogen regulatory protein PII-like uncharacterized protein